MILIDKAQSTQRILLTLSEVNPIVSGSTLSLFNQATNVTTDIALPTDTSIYPDRYNEFILTQSQYSGLSQGLYSYTVTDSTNSITQVGLLKVYDVIQTQEQEVNDTYNIPPFNEEDDDILTYNG